MNLFAALTLVLLAGLVVACSQPEVDTTPTPDVQAPDVPEDVQEPLADDLDEIDQEIAEIENLDEELGLPGELEDFEDI